MIFKIACRKRRQATLSRFAYEVLISTFRLKRIEMAINKSVCIIINIFISKTQRGNESEKFYRSKTGI